MPDIRWKRSMRGGWFFKDAEGNYWHKSENEEIIVIHTPDGQVVEGWSEESAWRRLDDNVA